MSADVALWDALEHAKRKPRQRVGKARAGAPPERVVQRQIVKTLRLLGLIVHHSPNGAALPGDSDARQKQAAVLRADGRMEGWPDLMVIDRRGRLACLEVKREGGIVSADQERVLALLARWNVPTAAICTLDEALICVRHWGMV
jgi:hypothetical protein